MLFCYGDINIDFILTVDKIPRCDEELPLDDFSIVPGGSVANFAIGASRLGVDTAIIGAVGNDVYGKMFQDIFTKEKIDITNLTTDPTSKTGTAVIIIDKSKNRRIMTYLGANYKVSLDFIDSTHMKKCKYFHMSSPRIEFIENFPFDKFPEIEFSIDAGNLLCSSKPELLLNILPYMSLFFVNEVELNNIFPNTTISSELVKKLGCKHIIFKKGKEGSEIYSEGSCISIPTFDVIVVDTTGAGDAYASGFLSQYIKGSSIKECGIYASALGSINTQQVGAQSGLPTKEQVSDFLKLKGV